MCDGPSWFPKICLARVTINFIGFKGYFAEMSIQSTTRTTEFFVLGILSVIIVKFAILVGTKSLEETAFSSHKGRDTLQSVNRVFLLNKKNQ